MSALRTVAAIGAALGFVAVTIYAIDSLGGPVATRERFGTAGLLVCFVAHWVLNLTPIGEILPSATANGAAWGFATGATISWLGYLAASATQYTVARRFASGVDVGARLESLPKRLRRLPVAHPAFQIFGRMLPVVGFHLVNVASAAQGVGRRRFYTCAALGHAPPALLMAGLGAGLLKLL